MLRVHVRCETFTRDTSKRKGPKRAPVADYSSFLAVIQLPNWSMTEYDEECKRLLGIRMGDRWWRDRKHDPTTAQVWRRGMVWKAVHLLKKARCRRTVFLANEISAPGHEA